MTAKPPASQTGSDATETHAALVFGDVVGSSLLGRSLGDLVMTGMLKEFFELVDKLERRHLGQTIKIIGDGFFAVFQDAGNALSFAEALQDSLAQSPISAGASALRVRIGIHAGPVLVKQASYGPEVVGDAVNVAARLSFLAGPGEIVVSKAARQQIPRAREWASFEHADIKGGGQVEFARLRTKAA